MPLSETSIRKLKPRAKPYKVADEKGLYLTVTPSGGRLWNMKFRTLLGTEKKLSFGSYPELSLREARDRRDEARKQLLNGLDPAEQKRRDKIAAKVSAANTFTAVAARLASSFYRHCSPGSLPVPQAASQPTQT